MTSQINAIDKQSVHKICSGQVVLDLATAVKELVENSIDAGATSVDVRFRNNGLVGFEVIDNGSGVDPSNYESLALKHYTSKLSTFEDLENVLTFGFRGEALSSLCALCNLTVITATKDQAPMGFKLEFDMNGTLTSKTPIARSVGTTLQLSNIFHSLPVRQQEFKRNIKREFAKALTIIQAYSIISTDIRISVSNQIDQKPSTRLMSTNGNKDLVNNISNVFGAKLASQVLPFKVDLESIVGEGSIEGYISKPEWGIGRSSTDRQYFYVNGRPCALPKLSKSLNEIYRTFISNQYPVIIANLKIPTDTYDVNVSPDKRTIFIHNEGKIAEAILEQLKEQLEPSRSTFQVNSLMSENSLTKPISAVNTDNSSFTGSSDIIPTSSNSISNSTSSTIEASGLIERVYNPSTSSSSRLEGSSTATRLFNNTSLSRGLSLSRGSSGSTTRSSGLGSFISAGNRSNTNNISSLKRPASTTSSLLDFLIKKPRTEEAGETVDEGESLESETMEVDVIENNIRDYNDEDESPLDTNMENEDQEAVYVGIKSTGGFWNTEGKSLKVSSNMSNMLQLLKKAKADEIPSSATSIEPTTLKNASIKNTVDNEIATEALSRVIHKPDFARMKVLGQFNLGFIIASLDDKDLYIIDQHASDEKYNFETLQETTRIETQKLLSPQELELTASEEHIVMDNLEIFKANGFGVEILPDNEPTKRIRVVSHPVSKNTVFDKKDFSELIFLINENPGEMVRCSRIRAMFAMRACHKAIVGHMGDIDQPWNCPHGRPSMRHLLSLDHFRRSQPLRQNRPITFQGTLFGQK
ncbi:hypothetical protein INT48_000061 [Thamnidium elegans]|uniref:DNA mismatch repair protein PMS1 n=1 Tax=Thamnidium elegans TaxID=101142 RepID=A0A8H7VZB9_9FUNG|nr:hypothetical protein INT48_000061 [Thamnidium elegans]